MLEAAGVNCTGDRGGTQTTEIADVSGQDRVRAMLLQVDASSRLLPNDFVLLSLSG